MKANEIIKLIESKIEMYEEISKDILADGSDGWEGRYSSNLSSLSTLQVLLDDIKGAKNNS